MGGRDVSGVSGAGGVYQSDSAGADGDAVATGGSCGGGSRAGGDRGNVEPGLAVGGFAAEPLSGGGEDAVATSGDCGRVESAAAGGLVAGTAPQRDADFGVCGPGVSPGTDPSDGRELGSER